MSNLNGQIKNHLIGIALTLALLVLAYSWHANMQLASDYRAVSRAYDISGKLEALMSHVTDGETGERGFLLTGKEVFLDPYRSFVATVDDDYRNLATLAVEDPVQREQMGLLLPMLAARRAEFARMIELRRDHALDFAGSDWDFSKGKALHDHIRRVVATMMTRERANIRQRNTDVAAATRLAQRAMWSVVFAVILLGISIFLISWKDRRGRIAAEHALREGDIERERLQAELESSLALLTRVGELAEVGGWEVNVHTKKLTWSREVYRIHDLDPSIVPDVAQAYDFYAPEARPIIRAAVESALLEGGAWDMELPLITAKGRRIWVRTIGIAVVRNGVPIRLEGAFQNISDRRKAQDALREANIQLVFERDRAEAANAAKSQFLANMSHEIRTPMNAILGMVQLLGKTELTARQHDYVNNTEGAAKSLLGILNDILDFSKIEAGMMTLECLPFSLERLMRDLAVILSSNLGGKNVEALLDIDTRLPLDIVGDSMRLRQVLINLIGNAVKFTERGEIVVSLKLLRWEELSVGIEFSVRDTGIGIAPEQLEQIFSGFSQGEASTTRRYGGTGLGLAISKRLVALKWTQRSRQFFQRV